MFSTLPRPCLAGQKKKVMLSKLKLNSAGMSGFHGFLQGPCLSLLQIWLGLFAFIHPWIVSWSLRALDSHISSVWGTQRGSVTQSLLFFPLLPVPMTRCQIHVSAFRLYIYIYNTHAHTRTFLWNWRDHFFFSNNPDFLGSNTKTQAAGP